MLSIGAVAKASGESVKTLRFWTDQNLLLAERGENLYRYYPENALERIGFIRKAQLLGFSLGEIRTILELKDKNTLPCEHVKARLELHLHALKQRMVQMQALEAELLQRLEQLEAKSLKCEGEGCVYLS